MVYLSAAIVLVGVLGVANLALTLALVRRLRSEASVSGGASESPVAPELLAPGTRAPDFSAIATSGAECSRGTLLGRTSLVGIFSGTCAPCRDHMPGFVALARQLPHGPDGVVAVVRGDELAAADLLAALDGAATVIVEPEGGPVGEAFSVETYPSMYVLDESGVIASAGHTASRLRVFAAA
jgi:thiol-disulfide isomerase/thioredoxin